MKKPEIKEIKDETTFPMQRHRVTSQASDGTIGVSDYQPSKHQATQQARERVGKLQSEAKGKK